MTHPAPSLLQPGEPPPFELINKHAPSRFFLTADHAGNRLPRALGNLGLTDHDLSRHIAWDIGIAGVTRRLATALNATAILQTYSRLVIDCNRPPTVPAAFPQISEATPIPGNASLTEADRLSRQQAIFDPYHNQITRLLAARQHPIYVAMHSFTPVYLGRTRSMHAALLYNRNPRLSHALAALLRQEPGLIVAENDPYQVSDATDYGVPVHAEAAGLDYLEIEIRQDLIETEAGQTAWAERLATLLPALLPGLTRPSTSF